MWICISLCYLICFFIPVVDDSVRICLAAVSMRPSFRYFWTTCGAPWIEPWHFVVDIINCCDNCETDILQEYLVLDIWFYFKCKCVIILLIPDDVVGFLLVHLLSWHGFCFFLLLCLHTVDMWDLILLVVRGKCCTCTFIKG